MAGWWMTASSLTIPKHSQCGRPIVWGQGENFVCVHVWMHVGAISIFMTLTDSWHSALTCIVQCLAWGLTLDTINRVLEVDLFLQWYFLLPRFLYLLSTLKLLCSSQGLQMICLCLCDLLNIHSHWCVASQIRKSPQKNQRWWKPSALYSWRNDGLEGRACCCLPLLLLFSLWGLRWVCRLRLFLLSSCLHFWLSYSLSCFSLSQPFSLSLSPTPYLVLSLSQGLNLWLWSYRNIGMTTHALFCFVS